MITRIIIRLQPVLQKNTYLFSKFDPPKDKTRQRNPFFGKSQTRKQQEKKDKDELKTSKKTSPFGKRDAKRDEKDANNQSRRLFGKSKQYDKSSGSLFLKSKHEEGSGNIFEAAPKLKMFQSISGKQFEDQTSPSTQQVEPQKHKQFSIYIQQEEDEELLSIDNANLALETKLMEDSSKILKLFNKKDWDQFSKIISQYQKLYSEKDLAKYIHLMLLNHNIYSYILWIQHSKYDLQKLPGNVLCQLLTGLISNGYLQSATHVCRSVKDESLNLEYSILDILFLKLQSNMLSSEAVTYRINLATLILHKIDRENSKEYLLGSWFAKLWKVSKYNRKLLDEFISLFQIIIINHYQKVYLSELHSSGLFIQILQTYYYGSHITTEKLSYLFNHILIMDSYLQIIKSLRNSMRLYRSQHRLYPFPNAVQLLDYLQLALSQEQYDISLLYYVLGVYNEQELPYTCFQNKGQVLQSLDVFLQNNQILNDGLLCTDKQYLNSIINDKQIEQSSQKVVYQNQEENAEQTAQFDEFAERIKFHNQSLRREIEQETNFSRREILKMLSTEVSQSNPLNSVKAAIKLQRYEQAYTIFKQRIMRDRIPKRIEKVIEYAVKAYMREHYKQHNQYDIYEVADGLTMKMIQELDLFQGQSSRTYLESIYQKLQNFDQLIWHAMPDGEMKHQFWETCLIEKRAHQLVKMDINGKLESMAYEKQYESLDREKPVLFYEDRNWRDEMILSLGIQETDATPQDSTTGQWVKYNSKQQFHEKALTALFDENHAKPQKYRYFGGATVTIEGEAEQYEGQQGQQYAVGQEGDEIAEAQEGQAAQQTAVEAQIQAAVQQAEEVQPIQEQAIEAAEEGQAEDVLLPEQNIIQYSQRKGIQGFDFNIFLKQSRQIYRPTFEFNYEYEKQFKRHMLAMEAIAEAARVSDNHSLQKKLNESEETITDPTIIAKLVLHKLWNYDFVTVEHPEQYYQRADQFRQRFFGFKKYMGMKQPLAIPSLAKQNISNFRDAIIFRKMTPEIVNQLLLKRHQLFLQADVVVRLEPAEEVEQIISWGVYNDEPLAVYLGQKLAMLTGQTISHKLALVVSKYLSHRRDIPQERIVRCKQALKIVGRINREHIYDINKDYEHITIRKQFKKYLESESERIQNESLNQIASVEPTYSSHKNFEQPNNRSTFTV